MNNELYRKLTSITLMTIMFAGGMTIAIPGETPVAIAQTGMLSVSATAAPGNSFGGPQIIAIVVDDPSRSETGDNTPDVTIDDNTVVMTQADTGKWYAYVASESLITAGAADLGFTLAAAHRPTIDHNDYTSTPALLESAARSSASGNPVITLIQTFAFEDDSDIDVVLGTETITLHYEEDLDDLATVSTDRTTGVPIGGQVHVTISDFRLNLDPTAADVWFMKVDGSHAEYELTDTLDADEVEARSVTDPPTMVWQAVFDGDDNDGGAFTIDDPAAQVSDLDDDDTDTTTIVRFEETGANTGVFESQNDDESNIEAIGEENDDFTIEYADDSVQVFIENFDSTLELIADGTWDSGETATVRLTNENLNLNTLKGDDLTKDSPNLPAVSFGDPKTLVDFRLDPTFDEDSVSVDAVTKLTTLSATSQLTTFTVTLTDDDVRFLNSTSASNYVHYYGGPGLETAGIQLQNTSDTSLNTIKAGLTKIPPLASEIDNEFTLTFTTEFVEPETATANTELRTARTNANNLVDEAQLQHAMMITLSLILLLKLLRP